MKFKIEIYDSDCESWEDWQSDGGLDAEDTGEMERFVAEDEIAHLRRRYGGKFRLRAVRKGAFSLEPSAQT